MQYEIMIYNHSTQDKYIERGWADESVYSRNESQQ